MPIPAFVQAGAGAVATAGDSTCSLLNATAGNFIIFHILEGGNASDFNLLNLINMDHLAGGFGLDIHGSDAAVGAGAEARHSNYVGRVHDNGTISLDLSVGVSGFPLYGRLYEFTNVVAGTTVVENGSEIGGTGTTVSDISVTTSDVNRLAFQLIAIADDQAIAAFTGETGGDWIEPVAEYTSVAGTPDGCLQLQIANMLNVGTINGGTATIGLSSNWGIISGALIGSSAVAQASDDPSIGSLGRGSGW